MFVGEFQSMFVELLMNILLREEETAEMRQLLRSCFITREERALTLYNQLYVFSKGMKNRLECFCVNPITGLSLCWLAEDFVMADVLVTSFSKQKATFSLLLQADALMQLLDSPIFMHLRLHLLDPHYPQYKALVCSLHTFTMALPQSESNLQMKNRLKSIESLYIVLKKEQPPIQYSPEDQQRIALYQSTRHWFVCLKHTRNTQKKENSKGFKGGVLGSSHLHPRDRSGLWEEDAGVGEGVSLQQGTDELPEERACAEHQKGYCYHIYSQLLLVFVLLLKVKVNRLRNGEVRVGPGQRCQERVAQGLIDGDALGSIKHQHTT